MPAEPEPPELARLVDYAERSRVGDWSLRSSLVRYAQSQPGRVSQVLELVRRTDESLHGHAKALAARGPALWASAQDGSAATGPDAQLVGVLRAAAELDRVAELLAAWADDRSVAERPDAEVDAMVLDVTARLDGLGVAREERTGPPQRGRAAKS